jgi:hypothetical protein
MSRFKATRTAAAITAITTVTPLGTTTRSNQGDDEAYKCEEHGENDEN